MVCIAVEDPWANPLYEASMRSEEVFNRHDRSPIDVDKEVKRLHEHAPFLCLEDTRIDWGIGWLAEDTETGYHPLPEKGKTRSGGGKPR